MGGRLAAWLIAASLGAAAAAPAAACSVCGCGDPLLSASDPAALNGRLRLQLETEYLTIKAGNEFNPALTDKLDQYSLRLNAVYSPLDGLTLIGTVPFTRKDLSTSGVTGSDLSGLGDLELGARYTLFDRPDFARQRRQSIAVSAGTSLPTGSNDATINGVRVDEHGQLGTGAWGPFAGVHYAFEQARWSMFASLSVRLRTTNAHDYRYGSALLWSIHGQFWAVPRLALDLGIDARHAAADTLLGAAVDSTGGTVLAAAPGVYWNVAGPVWLSLRAQLPFYTSLFGNQSVGPTVVAGVQYVLF